MSAKLLTEQHLEFLRLKGGCTCWSESTHVKIPHCWKSHVVAHLLLIVMELQNLRVEGANVTKGEQILNNGVVYGIDTVLLPSLTSVRDVLLQRQNQFGDLLLLLTITDLLPALSGKSGTYM